VREFTRAFDEGEGFFLVRLCELKQRGGKMFPNCLGLA